MVTKAFPYLRGTKGVRPPFVPVGYGKGQTLPCVPAVASVQPGWAPARAGAHLREGRRMAPLASCAFAGVPGRRFGAEARVRAVEGRLNRGVRGSVVPRRHR